MREHPALAGMDNREAAYRATWQQSLPDDEIARQQAMKESLHPGQEVSLKGYGRFVYSGIWDTMHTFYPVEGQSLRTLLPASEHRYIRRDLRGREYIELPYTTLADYVIL